MFFDVFVSGEMDDGRGDGDCVLAAFLCMSLCEFVCRATSGAGVVRSFRRLMALKNVRMACRLYIHLRRCFVFDAFAVYE